MRKIIIAILPLFVFACSDAPTEPPSAASVSLTVRQVSLPSLSIAAFSSPMIAVDSIAIARARILIKSIDFEGGDDSRDSDDLEFSTKPMLLDLSLIDSVQTVMVAMIPFGAYDEIEIEIRKLAFADTLARADSVLFADFIAGGYSIIIEGMTYKAGAGTQFVYSAAIRVEQEYDLDPPLIVSADSPNANVTLAIYSNAWFVRDGMILDPNDAANYNVIKWNIENSFEMYEDGDKDGDDGDDD